MGCTFSRQPDSAQPIRPAAAGQSDKPVQQPDAEAPAVVDAQDGAAGNVPTSDNADDAAIVQETPIVDEPSKGSGAEAEMDTMDETSAKIQVVIDIFKGVCTGFIRETLPDVEPVIRDAEKVFKDFADAVAEFELGDTNSMVIALGKLGEALDELKTAMNDAGAAKEQVEELARAVVMLRDPKHLVDHIGSEIFINGKSYLKMVQAATQAFNEKQWEAFGIQIGQMVGEVLTPEDPVNPSMFDALCGCCTCFDQPEFR